MSSGELSENGEGSGARRPRRDAAANRERILDRAEELFAESVMEPSLNMIAKDLGMGIGTVYRHFATVDELVYGVYRRLSERIDDRAPTFRDAESAFERVLIFIDTVIGFAVDYPFGLAVAEQVAKSFPERVKPNRWAPEIAAAIAQAQSDGELRDDMHATDVAVLAGMVAGLVHHGTARSALLVPRMRRFVLDALLPVGTERPPLPGRGASVSEVADMTHSRE